MPAGGTKGNKGGGRKSATVELEFNKKYNRFQEKWWIELNKMIDGNAEDDLKPELLDKLKEVFENDEYALKEIVNTLAKGVAYKRTFAMEQYNRLQVKKIPQDIGFTGDTMAAFLGRLSKD